MQGRITDPRGKMSFYPTILQNETLVQRNESDPRLSVVPERTDIQLVDIVLAGDPSAFEDLFERHKRYVAAIAAKYFRRPELVEEVVQTAFAKAFGDLPRFRGNHDNSFPSWIGRITSNTCLDILRSQKRKPEDLIEDVDEVRRQLNILTDASCENELLDRDLAAKLLSHLQAEDQALLRMLYGEDMTLAEAGEYLGWSLSKTKLRAWRAKKAIRGILKKYM